MLESHATKIHEQKPVFWPGLTALRLTFSDSERSYVLPKTPSSISEAGRHRLHSAGDGGLLQTSDVLLFHSSSMERL